MVYLECDEKFWECKVAGKKTTVRYGKVGANGAKQEKTHGSPAAATAFCEKMRKEKLKKGYSAAKRDASSEDDDESSSEEEPPAKKAKVGAKGKAVAKKPAPKPKAKKGKKPVVESSSESAGEEEEKKEEPKQSTGAAASPSPRGRPPVDSKVPGRDTWEVHEDYNCKLNQTNITGGSNNNKYYIIQVLKGKNGGWAAWNRWGRVGEDGQNAMHRCGNVEAAIQSFEKKFKDKTTNVWGSRDQFAHKPGKYHLVETEDTEGGGDEEPLGKLSKAQIEKGNKVLENLEVALDGKKGTAAIEQLTSQFYSLIPHDFGRVRAPVINTKEKLLEKVELLKFYLRMGFEELDAEDDADMTPISGVMERELKTTLVEAAKGICTPAEAGKCAWKGKALAEKQAGNPVRKMSAELYGSIMLYTGNAIYGALNKALREEDRSAVRKYFDYLRMFLEAMAHLPELKAKVYRGIPVDLYDQYPKGNVLTWWGVSSTTSDVQVAKNFMKGCGGKCTLLTIQAKTACDISSITFYSNEKEALLAPGTQLKVLSSSRKGNLTEITLEEVGRQLG